MRTRFSLSSAFVAVSSIVVACGGSTETVPVPGPAPSATGPEPPWPPSARRFDLPDAPAGTCVPTEVDPSCISCGAVAYAPARGKSPGYSFDECADTGLRTTNVPCSSDGGPGTGKCCSGSIAPAPHFAPSSCSATPIVDAGASEAGDEDAGKSVEKVRFRGDLPPACALPTTAYEVTKSDQLASFLRGRWIACNGAPFLEGTNVVGIEIFSTTERPFSTMDFYAFALVQNETCAVVIGRAKSEACSGMLHVADVDQNGRPTLRGVKLGTSDGVRKLRISGVDYASVP
jgi:hypothetical protein